MPKPTARESDKAVSSVRQPKVERIFTKCLEPADYNHMRPSVAKLREAMKFFVSQGCRIDIGHENRFWEYGMAMEVANLAKTGKALLDVGDGNGLFGPAMAYTGWNVLEVDSDAGVEKERVKFQKVLNGGVGRGTLRWQSGSVGALPESTFDVVSCVSVLEHLPVEWEPNAWKQLADKVKPGGLLFITVDCLPQQSGNYAFDNLRQVRFTTEVISHRVDALKAQGMEVFGGEDWSWHGPQVFDYTFFSVAMRRT